MDCEGFDGSSPVAAQYQTSWHEGGRGYPIRQIKNDEDIIDRAWAVRNLYPKFVYIFSDVVCYVTRNPRKWTHIAIELLEWAKIGASHAVNQYALPAAIIILNGPPQENEAWISDDLDALTREFFQVIGDQIEKSAFVRDLAEQVITNPLCMLIYH